MYQFINLIDKPTLLNEAANWFHSKWNVPKKAYLECMTSFIKGETNLGWFLALDNEKIIGGLGVINNDFHQRKDLTPNICALYVEKEYRNQGIAGKLLLIAVNDLKAKNISPVYLLTDHVGFYEKYGFKYYCMSKCDNGDISRIYIHL